MLSSVLIILLYLAAWAVVHSVLAGTRAKDWFHRRLGAPRFERYYRLAYSAFAVVTLLPVGAMLLWLPDRRLYLVPAPWLWLLVAVELAAMAGVAASLLRTGVLHLLGIHQLFASRPAETGQLQVRGLYACVRHPLYLFSIIFLWATPLMTVNWLTVAMVATLYFFFGSLHEEELLVREYGDAYRAYRRGVPHLLPLRPARCLAMLARRRP